MGSIGRNENHPGGAGPQADTYAVVFIESGLPDHLGWSVMLGGIFQRSDSHAAAFEEPNGSFGYVVGSIPGWHSPNMTGTITVNGTDMSTTLAWTRVNYTVTFLETGLPQGAMWWLAILNASPVSSSSSAISVQLANGSYAYMLGTFDQAYASPAGSFVVQGAGLALGARFSPITAEVVFTETGLPPGTEWSVDLNGSTRSGAGDILFPRVTIGTAPFTVEPAAGYAPDPSQGSVLVLAPRAAQGIRFSPTSPAPGGGLGGVSGGLDGLEADAPIAGVIAVIIAAAALMVLLGPKDTRPPADADTPPFVEDIVGRRSGR